MPAPRILFVKLSSLGDVVHHFPAVSDVARRWPDAHLAWAVEAPYAPLVRLHPAVNEVIEVNLRALKRAWYSVGEWGALRAARKRLAATPWDYVVDTQGLIKSASLASAARGAHFGPDRKSAREKLAARWYDVGIPVARPLHAVQRNRLLAAQVFGYPVESAPDYGLGGAGAPPAWAPLSRYIVLLHAASNARKTWPEAYWVELGQIAARSGFASVVPAGSEAERARAHRIAIDIPHAIVAPPAPLDVLAALLANAWAVVGVDTGLTHLAVALGRPTVGIYCATDPALTGLNGAHAVNLGAPDAPPSVEAVARTLGCAQALDP